MRVVYFPGKWNLRFSIKPRARWCPINNLEGQAEFIIAKHRNGGLENIRLKFIGHLGKFDNLDDFDSPFDTEFHSKMNAAANDDTFKQEDFRIDPSQAFGDSDDDTPY